MLPHDSDSKQRNVLSAGMVYIGRAEASEASEALSMMDDLLNFSDTRLPSHAVVQPLISSSRSRRTIYEDLLRRRKLTGVRRGRAVLAFSP